MKWHYSLTGKHCLTTASRHIKRSFLTVSRDFILPTLNGITIVPISTLLQRQSPRDFLLQHTLMVKTGDLSFTEVRLQLKVIYRYVDQVFGPGGMRAERFNSRLVPMGSKDPPSHRLLR
ncbi:hypothetical protein O9929_19305 [Vibrio lentus]|nr:hypothetical protein [Vibrio lentus]